ncbi:MAG: DUF523 and DUF1722 domain-containing protein [Gemmatimonadales bacterium]|nr:DUF523 and DUF1722 domain-containing protein [Gemmatimonadales bacterium]
MSETTGKNIQIGVSACLLGQEVRYDGGHRRDNFITDTLGGFFELIPVCPESEIGMGTPRETITLAGDPGAPGLIAPDSGRNWTQEMGDWSNNRSRELAGEDLCGFVFKKNSPSCGLYKVPVIQENGETLPLGRGFFAASFVRFYPLVPVEDEERLSDAGLRENFLVRVFAYQRVKEVFSGVWQSGAIEDFHNREKHLLLAHSPQHYDELCRLIADLRDFRPAAFHEQYLSLYMKALSAKATMSQHMDTLQDITSHLRGKLSSEEQRRLIEVIEDFRGGGCTLAEPVGLLRSYFEMHQVHDMTDLSYLNPYPPELMNCPAE